MGSLLVTGGTGTLGRALIASALHAGAYDRVVCYSRDEFKQEMMSSTSPFKGHPKIRFFLGDVRDPERLDRALGGVSTVVHAAALKWVAGGVYNVDEIVKTNVVGTMHVIESAARAGAKQVLFISSDKSCHATNVYGASKFMAEQYAVQANSFTFPRGCRVAAVRYGNVLWSRGSVAHRFAASRPPYRLTDARMTRFGIRLSAAVKFVETSLECMRGGEVFIPRLPSFRVQDVAHARYHSVFALDTPAPIEITGLRPGGEKLHETLLTEEESTHAVWAGDRWVVEPVARSWDREPWRGEPVPEGWTYTSDKNPEWMSESNVMASFSEMDPGLSST